MNKDKIKKEVVASLADHKTLIKEIKIQKFYTNWFSKFLCFIRVLPKFKNIKVYLSDPKPATVVRLLGEIIELKISKSNNDLEVYEMIKCNIPIFINFLAIAIHNKKGNAPDWLIHSLGYDFSKDEISDLSLEVYRRLDLQTFFGITGSMVNLNQMVGSILEGEAPSISSETPASTTGGQKNM